ncbi:hypothetical protein [Pseudomonas sp. GL-B-16]|uniref:hypothetical protein n=1 Tax=Pseudomonas sp. GL-B-16 TaxID=2832373 RepID=UPI001CBD28E5|nr:hypothetical protein [Pseudomonas sp. GL-B-16]
MNVSRPSHISPQYQQHVDTSNQGQETSSTAADKATPHSVPSSPPPPHSKAHRENDETGPSRGSGLSHRPRSLSETRIQTQLSSNEDEKILSIKDFDKSLEDFGDFFTSYTMALHDELNSMKGTVGDLSASLTAIQKQKSKLEEGISERKEGAKARAISRENAIKELQKENQGLSLYKDQSNKLMAKMQIAVDFMVSKLGNLNNELGKKSKVISSQSNMIKKIKESSKEIKNSHYEDLEVKDRIIVEVKNKLNNLQSELDTEKQKNALLQSQLDAISSTERQFTPAKSDALVKTGKKISDHSEVLQTLNIRLLVEQKIMRAQSAENRKEIAQLKDQLIKLAGLAGIDLPEAG